MPSRSRSSAVVSPTIPAPTTTTSAPMSRSSGGRAGAPPCLRTRVSAARAAGYPVLRGPTPGQEVTVVGSRVLLRRCSSSRCRSPPAAPARASMTPPRWPSASTRRSSGDGRAACGELSAETASKARAAGGEAVRAGDPDPQAAEGRHGRRAARGGHERLHRLPGEARTSSTRARTAGRSRRPAASPGASSTISRTTARWRAEMRAMFVVYLVLITVGIAYCVTLGLLHN